LECIVTITRTVFIYFEMYCQLVEFSRVSRVRFRVSVSIRVRFSFIGANLYNAIAPLRFFGESRPWVATRYCRDRSVVR